ncbi:Capsanthin/capsorubin synthase, chromoplast [Apostasia shenzhenica]|uniref:Capsanthin/capsorubin synthase, chromoplast n=1 Tax=Apostasia shenzhenica TaxID=1088818 RepID=A0A2I0AL62_9ASPA|nr:Capsanthin/capsorubin synthase, chromoplast [Apostasia shenzhenica]
MAAAFTLLFFSPPPLSNKLLAANPRPLIPSGSIRSSRGPHLRCSFFDLQPEHHPESLSLPLDRHDPSGPAYDAAIIGCGPSGLRLAELASSRGLRICCIDPAPLSPWPNNYGSWVDELTPLGLPSCIDHIWSSAAVFLDERSAKLLERPYCRISRRELKTRLLESCAAAGVRFHRARALSVNHQEFSSSVSCSDGTKIPASLVIDATGFASLFVDYDAGVKRDHGYQIAHGILAEVDSHPFDPKQMVLMDWRDGHMANEPYLRQANLKTPTFLYAMPLDERLVFLEETSLVSRPMLSYNEIKKRMAARLRHLGIRVRRVLEDEKCVIRMGGPLPRMPQGVVGLGGAAAMAHPSTGYMVARTLAVAPAVADAMAECLGSTRMIRGRQLQARVWASLWTPERRAEREFYKFGMETLLRLDLAGTRAFFDAFFDLDPYYWQGFLSSKLSLWELLALSLALFRRASGRSKMDVITKCPLPLARMAGNLAHQYI